MSTAAAFDEIMRSRWSCRAYLDQELPEGLIHQIFATAQRTASWCNTQPWRTYFLTGAATKRFAASLVDHVRDHQPASDLARPERYVGVYRDRRRQAGFQLYASLGVDRENLDARAAQHLRNYEFFGAPHVAVVTTDRDQATYGAIDCGAYVANVMNAATSLGIATIPQAAIAMYSGHVRAFLELPDDRQVVCAISFGYPDPDHPANSFRTSRGDPDQAVTYLNS
ncbi:nitroreductase [Kribbella sp. NPDC051137]|uniref:nitroreductase n=1 Tax=Kribbella sp. NPDC051137 TaxID=3155045 RepID=UPI0034127A23